MSEIQDNVWDAPDGFTRYLYPEQIPDTAPDPRTLKQASEVRIGYKSEKTGETTEISINVNHVNPVRSDNAVWFRGNPNNRNASHYTVSDFRIVGTSFRGDRFLVGNLRYVDVSVS